VQSKTKRKPGARWPNVPRPPRGTYRNGIDLTQIRQMLALTPAERLEVLQSASASLAELCASAKKL
jgi:hypothetical protein